MAEDARKPSLNPAAMPHTMAGILLSKAGPQSVTVERLEATCGRGVPRNGDGSLHLIHFAAWLVRELARWPLIPGTGNRRS